MKKYKNLFINISSPQENLRVMSLYYSNMVKKYHHIVIIYLLIWVLQGMIRRFSNTPRRCSAEPFCSELKAELRTAQAPLAKRGYRELDHKSPLFMKRDLGGFPNRVDGYTTGQVQISYPGRAWTGDCRMRDLRKPGRTDMPMAAGADSWISGRELCWHTINVRNLIVGLLSEIGGLTEVSIRSVRRSKQKWIRARTNLVA